MADRVVTSSEIVTVFGRLRAFWKGLFDEAPDAGAREGSFEQLREDFEAVTTVARLSEEARPFVELAYLMRLGQAGPEGEVPEETAEAVRGVRSGFEMRLRTLRQMESGDEILPDSGRQLRMSAARDLVFFRGLPAATSGPSGAPTPPESRRGSQAPAPGIPGGPAAAEPEKLVQSFDPRRKLIGEEIEVPNAALEAIEFLVRLGAG